MANINQGLQPKSSNANTAEYFVFLPNELNSTSHIDGNPMFRDAVAAKNMGNDCFQNNQHNEAIVLYNRAIGIIEGTGNKSGAILLSVCYQNRASALAYQENYKDAIADASKAIQLNEHYSKAYYRRAMCYFAKRQCYLALQDIMQACVLERFKNSLHTDAAVNILAEIDKIPETIQWIDAYVEMDAASLICGQCADRYMELLITCGVFEPIRVPIPESQPLTGYIRAMAALKIVSVTEILKGCKEEIASRGRYWAHSCILQAYVSTVAIPTPSNDAEQYINHMDDIISDATIPEAIKHQAKFCRAHLSMSIYLYAEAHQDLKSLEGQYSRTSLFHVIKSGALLHRAYSDKRFLRSLEVCAKMLPDVYQLQFQAASSKANHISDLFSSLTFKKRALEDLIDRFPSNLEPRRMLVAFYIELEPKRAIAMLTHIRRDFPKQFGELISLYGELRPTQPACVYHYKQAIRAHKDDPIAFNGLIRYFETTTYEYAKAIEVYTKAMNNYLILDRFKLMFNRRQRLLKQIIRHNFWDKL